MLLVEQPSPTKLTNMAQRNTAAANKRENRNASGEHSRSKQSRVDIAQGLNGSAMEGADRTGFCHGSIVRIKLINFLTYDDVEFKPGSNLNVIVGPNGTGKSSIVCALCLGLGEKPTTLGRAKDPWEFVKHKKNKATIEIELKNEKGNNYIIKREIQKAEKRNIWSLNGKQTTFTEVQGKMRELNVQMSNLCQFLPQDRVVEFAKMSQQELLIATEKAVGPPGMYDDHLMIIELREKERTFEASLKEKQEHRERLLQKNSLLERDVQRYNERQSHLDKIELLEKKKPWAEYEESRLKFVAVKERKDSLEKNLKEAQKIADPMRKELDVVNRNLSSIKQKKQKLLESGQAVTTKTKRKNDQLEKQSERIEEVSAELRSIKDQEKQRQKRMRDLQKNIDSLEKDFGEAPDPEELQPRNQEISNQMKDVNREMTNHCQEASSLKEESDSIKANLAGLKSQLREINDIGNRRLNKLNQVDKQAYDAVQWLNNNRNKFRGRVYEPIMLQINLKNSDDAKYLESTIPFRDLVAFVCESKEDQQLFLEEVREKQNLKVNVVYPAARQPLSDYKPKHSIDQIKRFGFTKFVSDLFDAPETVTRYLYESCNLYNIPIADSDNKAKAEQAIEISGFDLFFTPTQRFKITQSLYGNKNKSTMTSGLQQGKLLSIAVDMDRKKQLETEMAERQERYNEICAKHQQCVESSNALKKKLETLRVEKKELQKQMSRRRTLQTQIDSKKKSLDNIVKEAPNIEKEEEKARTEITKINKKRVELTKEYQADIESCLELYKERLILALKEGQIATDRSYIESRIKESSKNVQHIEEEFRQVQGEFHRLREAAKRLLAEARKKTNTPDKQELSAAYRDNEDNDLDLHELGFYLQLYHLTSEFAHLPNTVEEIEDMIHEEKAKADCNRQTDPKVLNEYKRNNAEINKLNREAERLKWVTSQLVEAFSVTTGQIEGEEGDQSSITTQISDIKERWLKPLEKLLAEINTKYCDFFKRMGCAGQVTLHKDPDNNYKLYGIEIKVMYRSNERLKVLTAHHQSGGERSVATMLYLISLQELTNCPFRVVDEINQGMDPSNERRVFDLVVETVCRPGTSQYFLITPKLLPDLNYTDRMTVLSVLNGHWLAPHSKVKVREFIRKKKASQG